MIICVINSPGFFYSLQDEKKFDIATNRTITTLVCSSSPVVIILRDMIHLTFRAVIPAAVQTVANILLLRKFLKAKRLITATTISMKREKRFGFTVLILNTIFIITDVVAVSSVIFLEIYGYNQTYISTTSNESAIASLSYVCTYMFVWLIMCDMLFFINLLTNKTFRKETKKTFRITPKH